jgi:uncharacterized protein YoxC
MIWEIGLLLIGIAFLLIAIFSIPALLQIRTTAQRFQTTSETLNRDLPNILHNLDEITSSLTGAADKVQHEADRLTYVVDKVREMTDDVVNLEKNIRREIESPIVEVLGTLTATVKGLRAFLEAIRS